MDLWYIIKTSMITVIVCAAVLIVYQATKERVNNSLKSKKKYPTIQEKRAAYFVCTIITSVLAGMFYALFESIMSFGSANFFVVFFIILVPSLWAVSDAHDEDQRRNKWPSHWTNEQVSERERLLRHENESR